MKIVIAHFTNWWVGMSGGVEKVVCQFANAMCGRGHDVTVLYIGDKEGSPYYALDDRIRQVNILFENGRQVVTRRLPVGERIHREIGRLFSQRKAQEINTYYRGRLYGPRIRKWFEEHEADVVVSCSPDSAKYLMVDAECTLPMIEMTHVDPAVEFHNLSKYERAAIRKARLLQLPLASGLKAADQYFPGLPTVIIGNPVNKAEKMANPGVRKAQYTITGVGFVNGSKNWKLLAEAFEGLHEKYPDWRVEIWGAPGAHGYSKRFQAYIEKHHMGDSFFLRGKTDHITDVYAKSDIFAFPSKSEGFGMALSEAMSAGLPAVGLKMCNGVNSLIKDGVNGYLTEASPEAFREALERLMKDAALRAQMGNAGVEAMKAYAPEIIWDLWEHALGIVAVK